MAIRGTDQVKLLRAGYRLLRVRGKKIMYLTGGGGWIVFQEFTTSTLCKREFSQLREDEKTLEG